MQRPIIHVEVDAGRAIDVQASYENWRAREELIPNDDRRRSFFTLDKYPGEVRLGKDTVAHRGERCSSTTAIPTRACSPTC